MNPIVNPMTDIQVRNKGLRILQQELGSIDMIRFLSQISHEIRDYMTIQDELFENVTIDDLYEQAKRHQHQKAVTMSHA